MFPAAGEKQKKKKSSKRASLAHLVEQLFCNQQVARSSRAGGSNLGKQMHTEHKEKIIRNVYYDAEFCELCDVWIEGKCDDMRCNFCPQRPVKPSEAIYK